MLDQIGAQSIPTIATFSKCDLLDAGRWPALKALSERPVRVRPLWRGHRGARGRHRPAASSADAKLDVLVPYQPGDLVSLAHERCHIISETTKATGTRLQLLAAPAFVARSPPFTLSQDVDA